MSRPTNCSMDSLGNPPFAAHRPDMLRLVCFLKPGEYTNRFERFLTRQDVVVLRARHEMHAYWTSLTTAPHAVITDLPVTSLDRSYLLSRLARNPKTANLPILVFGAESSSKERPASSTYAQVHVLEVTTPTRMGQIVLDHVRHLSSKSPRPDQTWRADNEPHELIHDSPSVESNAKSAAFVVPRQRRASALSHGHVTSHREHVTSVTPSELIAPRRRELQPPESSSSHMPGTAELTVPRRVRPQADPMPDSHPTSPL
jgi:hypothetical protein